MKQETIDKILKEMSLEDRVALCSGKNFWETKSFDQYGIPSFFMCDGPLGLRKQNPSGVTDMMEMNNSAPATCFPAEVTTAASWDPSLLKKIGQAIGREAKEQKSSMVLGPGANLKRNPLCGRNFEYFSEDPYLTGKLAAGFIQGLEGEGVASCLKHFAANSQEKSRFNSNSVMDERTLRELYLTGFEIAVKEGKPSALMCAYPKLNGIHCSDNKELLTEILREDWDFQGAVITDWGAMCDRIEAFRAGCDLNMPGGSSYMEKEVLAAVRSGSLPEEAVNRCAERILKLAFQAQEVSKEPIPYDYREGHEIAKEAAVQGAVLLKNEGSLLPLKKDQKIAVIGAMAKQMRFQGAGSSHINPAFLSQPADYMENCIFADGCTESGDTTEELLAAAAEAAAQADAAIVFAGLPDRYESEGFDRSDMRLPEGHRKLIDAVCEANPDTAVVLLCGCAVECDFADRVEAVLYMGLPGQAGGEAAADLLYGRANPSGRLAESWPLKYEDCPSSSFYGKEKDALYLEGVYVGYRYYDKANMNVRWPFGFGLSYTEFTYSDLAVTGDLVSLKVCNTGYSAGAETVQLYIEAPQDGIHRPLRELKGFQKIWLEPGEEKSVSFRLDARCFTLWQDGWCVPSGTYRICIGKSSRELMLETEIEITGEETEKPARQENSWYETLSGEPRRESFDEALGFEYQPEVLKKGSFTMDNSIEEMKDHSRIMKIIYKIIERTVAKSFGGKRDSDDPEFHMLMSSAAGSPLRSMQIFSGIKGSVMQGLLEMANGHFFSGLAKMLKK